MLLLKATSQATIQCLSNCLSLLQQQQIAPAYTPSTFHSTSSASSSAGVLQTRKTSTLPSVQYYDCDTKKRYVVSGYLFNPAVVAELYIDSPHVTCTSLDVYGNPNCRQFNTVSTDLGPVTLKTK
jgi:hypothetical protein